MKRSEFKWDAAHLEQFLSNPQAIVLGNRMPYLGLEDKAQLKILVNYLLTMGQ
jgi:cytochrome c